MTDPLIRLDRALVDRGIAETRSKAQAMILARDVRVDGLMVDRAGQQVGPHQTITLRERQRFVSRGGEKLQHALDEYSIDVDRLICGDIGASTGGFTDSLLKSGAARVYAIDVGYGQIDLGLRQDPRVVVMDRTNARYLTGLSEPLDLVAIDVSFISLRLIFPAVAKILREPGQCIALVKPQFEAGRGEIGKKGVVRDPAVHRQVLRRTIDAAIEHRLNPAGLLRSPLRGPQGNIEFLLWLRNASSVEQNIEALIDSAMEARDESFSV